MFQKLPFDLSGMIGTSTRRFWLPQREFNWQLMMPHDIGGWQGAMISQYCQSVRFGDYNIDKPGELRYGHQMRHYAGLQAINQVTLTFVLPVDSSVVSYFYAWHKLIVDDEGLYFAKNHYAKDIFVVMYDRTGLESMLFRLNGCWPKNRPDYTLAYEKEGVVTIEMRLMVDKVVTQFLLGHVMNKVHAEIGRTIKNVGGVLGKVGGSVAKGFSGSGAP